VAIITSIFSEFLRILVQEFPELLKQFLASSEKVEEQHGTLPSSNDLLSDDDIARLSGK
jgi:hypothetical protein